MNVCNMETFNSSPHKNSLISSLEMKVDVSLVEKGWFASNPGPLFVSDLGPTAQVSTQMTYQWSASNVETTQIFNYLRRTMYTVRRK